MYVHDHRFNNLSIATNNLIPCVHTSGIIAFLQESRQAAVVFGVASSNSLPSIRYNLALHASIYFLSNDKIFDYTYSATIGNLQDLGE